MDNRNQQGNPRTRRDSIPPEQRRGMQNGYPVRNDASQNTGRPANRPTGPKEVPSAMRRGNIPVRQNANTDRTYPIMNRNGQEVRPPEQAKPTIPNRNMPRRPITLPTTEAEELPKTRKPLPPELFEDDFLEDTKAVPTEAPDPPEANDVDNENFLIVTRKHPEPETEETVKAAKPEKAPAPAEEQKTAVPADADTVSAELAQEAADTPAAEEAAAEPDEINMAEEALKDPVQTEDAPSAAPVEDSSSEDESDVEKSSEESTSEEASAEEASDEEASAEEASTEEASTMEFSIIPSNSRSEDAPEAEEDLSATQEFPVVAPKPASAGQPAGEKADAAESAEETPAVQNEDGNAEAKTDTAGTVPPGHGKKLWILPLAAAILAALGLCVGIPAAMSSRETVPDFDMTVQYNPTEGTEQQPADTGSTETVPAKFNVTLTFFDRKPIYVSTAAITLGDLLQQLNYTVQETDRFPVAMDTLLTEDTTLAVDTVTYATATETITIPYESYVTNVQTIPRGQKSVTQYGKNGTKTITYTLEMVNGVEASRTVAKEEITKEPVHERYQLGVGGTLVGNDGKTYSYSYYRMVNATYYDIEGLTYLGYEADESVVAVDMDYIPLGTKIYVKNDQFDFGVRIAADTGSMIEGWEVDIWLDDANPQKKDFAYIGYVKNMRIYYLE